MWVLSSVFLYQIVGFEWGEDSVCGMIDEMLC